MSRGSSKSALDRGLSVFTDVHAGEGLTALLMLVNVFLLLICYSVFNRIPVRIHSSSMRDAVQGLDHNDLGHLIRVETSAGFWLTLAAILGAAVATWMARQQAPP